MDILRKPEEMLAWSQARSREGGTIALVPTMGFFHEGHLSLMRRAAELCDTVVVSLFVNPTQFGPNEDLDRYPRDFECDMELVCKEPVAAVFAPTPELMYLAGFQTEVRVTQLSTYLCGKSRPVHFAGVATVVTKLFNIVRPEVAVFGEKDFQQLAIIRRLVTDLNIPVRIVGHPIVREADGLAMSSRNANLDPANRAAALSLSTALRLVRTEAARGVLATAELGQSVARHIHSFAGTAIDYASFVDGDSLEAVETVDERTILALAVHVDGKAGKVRLIDNGFVLPQ
ncbi:MAG: pantoate--beta-alanine ligase [Desulfobulbus sp.]|jgi:pantoate--beta-alanine ligase|uniref:pantoate--beta-alanine ligase n=1 Tax=Desulfobulbus sp. TaxID=895 RepID=UPI00284489D9|nr:pantoate--beta-alanine ligase [Desulfobulbus sp.]MDR2550325.1 pantoate--beta-alanine ligase [Desulfobulbus sp.]